MWCDFNQNLMNYALYLLCLQADCHWLRWWIRFNHSNSDCQWWLEKLFISYYLLLLHVCPLTSLLEEVEQQGRNNKDLILQSNYCSQANSLDNLSVGLYLKLVLNRKHTWQQWDVKLRLWQTANGRNDHVTMSILYLLISVFSFFSKID